MKKMLVATTAAAVLLVAGAVQAEGKKADASVKADANVTAEPGIGSAISNTAGAAYEKSAQGVNTIKGSYHQNMADSKAEAAQGNLATGDLNAAAANAKDAAEHQASALEAKGQASANKTKASKDWAKAKAAVSTSGETK